MIRLWHPGNLWSYQSLARVKETQSRAAVSAAQQQAGQSESFSSPALPHPVHRWVPWHYACGPHTQPHVIPLLFFAIMTYLRSGWQIYCETGLSKWPAIALERSQLSECFFLACSILMPPEVSRFISNACPSRQEKVWIYQFVSREAFCLPQALHICLSGCSDKDAPSDGSRGGERISLSP